MKNCKTCKHWIPEEGIWGRCREISKTLIDIDTGQKFEYDIELADRDYVSDNDHCEMWEEKK